MPNSFQEMGWYIERCTTPCFNRRLYALLRESSEKENERSIQIAIEDGDRLPENVMVEILSWLPVKDLLQFKSVSKSWYAIISSADFISKHLKNYYDNNKAWRACILAQYYSTHAELMLYELALDDTPRVVHWQSVSDDDMPLDGSYICGPCDGLYYLFQYNYSGRAIWNPALNEFKRLPLLISKPNLPSYLTFAYGEECGFGLDPITRDYKVVLIKSYWHKTDEEADHTRYPLSVFVYSTGTESWRYCGDLSGVYVLEKNRCYIFVKACCYWLGSCVQSDGNRTSEVIISFDLTTDAFQERSVPNYAQPSAKCLAMYDGCLAFLSLRDVDKFLDIWTLDDGLWTKKVCVGPFSDLWQPVGHWKDNRLILEDGNAQLVLFEPDTQELRYLGFHGGRSSKGVFAYVESLVPIKDRKQQRQSEEVEVENGDT